MTVDIDCHFPCLEFSYNLPNLSAELYAITRITRLTCRRDEDPAQVFRLSQDEFRGSLVYSTEEFSAPLGDRLIVTKITPTDREDLDRKDYYPFGKPWNNPDLPTSDNRYTFSGKEQQILRGQDIAYSDFGARFYDSDGVTFMQQDPLMHKYFPIGQYVYCIGNPLRYVDPNGKELLLVGSAEQQNLLLGLLQQLTNYKLTLNQNGIVTHSILKTENKGTDYHAGNSLLEQLCDQSKNAKTTTVRITDEKSSVHPVDENAYNRIGSDADIRFNPNENPSLITQNKTSKQVQQEGRPAHIGLAHELIHGIHINSGNTRPKTVTLQSTITINGERYLETLPFEEATTVGLHGITSQGPTENKIRKEHNLNTRIFYSSNFPKL